jgi:hypothetical protein
MINDFYDKAINNKNIEDLFEWTNDANLIEHYAYDDVIKWIKSHDTVTLSFKDDNTIYYKLQDSNQEKVFDINFSNFFSKTDSWLSDKIIQISSIFSNNYNVEMSVEQTGF